MAHTAPTQQANCNHTRLQDWVDEVAALTQPDDVYWCDGSDDEYDQLAQKLVEAGTFERLSDDRRPNSYLALSDPDDVARVEDRTFICSEHPDDAGHQSQADEYAEKLIQPAAGRRLPPCQPPAASPAP